MAFKKFVKKEFNSMDKIDPHKNLKTHISNGIGITGMLLTTKENQDTIRNNVNLAQKLTSPLVDTASVIYNHFKKQ
jgi:hypothetical protein